MSIHTKAILGLFLVAFAAACAPKTKEVVYAAPVAAEPVYTSKYK